jgi:hypothetical protein
MCVPILRALDLGRRVGGGLALATFGTTMLAYLRVLTADHRVKRVEELGG